MSVIVYSADLFFVHPIYNSAMAVINPPENETGKTHLCALSCWTFISLAYFLCYVIFFINCINSENYNYFMI